MSDLNKIFKPDSVAVVGASNTPGKVGYSIIANMISCGYEGKIYPINPNNKGEIQGLKAYANIKDIPEKVDLVIMSIPAALVNNAVKECGEAGVKNMVVISAGFKETGEKGAQLEKELTELGKKYKINIIGPNSLGTIDCHTPLNTSFSQMMPNKGNIAFISQSGAMMVAIIDWSVNSGIGFSKVISLGNKAGVNEIELLKYLADDPETSVIICYLESISDDENFIKTMRKTANKKPIIILKSGSSSAGAQAASSHTGALAGSDLAFETAFKQAGILRVKTMADLFDLGLAFSKAPLPTGPNVAIITNAGGGGVVTVDAMEDAGLKLVKFNKETTEKLKKCIPDEGSTANPIDVLGDAPVIRYKESLDIILEDNNVDSLIIMVCPTASTDPDGIADVILEAEKKFKKPILVVNMGGPSFEQSNEKLRKNNVPTYIFPETAINALNAMTQYANIKNKKYTNCITNIKETHPEKVSEIFKKVKNQGRDTLLGSEAYEVAQNYGIDAAPIKLATSADQAAEIAKEIGFPVVLKIASDKILHKSDIGGVKTGIQNTEETKKAYNEIINNTQKAHPDIKPDGIEIQKMMPEGKEIIIGMIKDKQFGPMIAFGMGGIYVNLIEDVTFNLAQEISCEEIDEQIESTKVATLLNGYRGEEPCDKEKIKEIIKRVAKLTLDFPEIAELDINPIFAYKNKTSALDIKIKLE